MYVTAADTLHQDKEFVVLLVQDHVLRSASEREKVIAFAEIEFGVRAILLGEDSLDAFGADDLGRMLQRLDLDCLPWREYPLAA